ncbi:S49 family peptidase [Runella slithyformis]|uniref:S49 family peptidase n=1 Tax=Runella slithyformis TaxID=106 RepID=UPI0002DCDF6F|nr:S49 family peptidase [Runella slithyformis]
MGRTWALEPRFHNAQSLALIRRMTKGGDSTIVIPERMDPSAVDPKAAWTDSRGQRHYGWNVAQTKTGKVAIIPIMGAMSRYGDLCAYGTEDISNFILEANALDEVTSIVLQIDSPGGDVNGTELLGDIVRTSQKPIVAYVQGMAASAAYWVASQAREIIMESETSTEVGSIGVLAVHVDASAFYEKEGIKVTIIRSEGSQDKALFNDVEGLSEKLKAEVKAQLAPIKAQFIKTVKAGRPNIGEVFTGKMYNGKAALQLGMADRIGYLGDAVYRADLLARKQQTNN